VPLAADGGGPLVAPLGTGERDALGFAALYHGWVYVRDADGAVRALPPDGPACGVIARRAIERGAWVAPANEPLRGAIALERPAAPERWPELQQLQLDVVRQHPHGFVVLNADTLAADDDVRPIGVRRLLILLRRLAARLGATYVFEPNDDAFRRTVQRGFEALLGDLFARGAFAGRTAAEGFQVVTGEALNTPQSVERGRFIVELRVAPSRPMAFLTLRLVQTGDRVAVTGA
jgi:phage tail sheath protein FI